MKHSRAGVWVALGMSLSGATAVSPAIAQCTQPAARLEVRLFKYGGVGPQEVGDFSRFHTVLAQKLKHIRARFMGEPGTAYVKTLRIHPEEIHRIRPSPGEQRISLLWDFHDRTLAILTGIIKGNDVASEFFWSDRHRHGFSQTISAKWHITLDDFFPEARDTHSLIVLTALGIDALERGCPDAIYLGFFSEANNVAQDLEGRGSKMTGDISRIRAFLAKYVTTM